MHCHQQSHKPKSAILLKVEVLEEANYKSILSTKGKDFSITFLSKNLYHLKKQTFYSHRKAIEGKQLFSGRPN